MFPLMLYLSLGANAAIAGPLSWMILRDRRAICTFYGPDSPSRRLLGCLYATVALLSLLGIYAWPTGHDETAMAVLLGLLPLQVISQVMGALVLPWRNPVVPAQLGLAALHGITLSVVL